MLKLPNDKYIPFIGLEHKSYNGDNYMDLLGRGKYVIYRTDQSYFLIVNNLYYRLPLLYH